MDWADHDGSVSVVFEADDWRKLDMLDSLRRAHKRDPMGDARVRTASWVGGPLVLVGACLTTVRSRSGVNALGYVLVTVVILVIVMLQRGSVVKSAPKMDVRTKFELRITRETFALTSDGMTLAEISLRDLADVVTAGDHLELVHGDGTTLRLPVVLPAHASSALAAEIGARIREMRSLGSYRD